uniref:Ribosomal_L7Ae domain-containing protein n=1 Tax=Panagrellus redivivus TaxID=6233 RepID=A0A7E4ZS78_PANRE
MLQLSQLQCSKPLASVDDNQLFFCAKLNKNAIAIAGIRKGAQHEAKNKVPEAVCMSVRAMLVIRLTFLWLDFRTCVLQWFAVLHTLIWG